LEADVLGDRLTNMFEMQDRLQRETYGFSPTDMDVNDAIAYIKNNVLAATDELHEALGEVDWKPWTTGEREIRTDAFAAELVDVWHFLMNMFLALGYTPGAAADVLYEGYRVKRDINETRQVQGYDGRSTKCGACGRALDDPAVACTREPDQGYCAVRDVDVNYLDA
jgi:hypothetical protein